MKQAISPKAFVAIIAVAVVILVGGIWWVWKAPSASAGTTAGGKSVTSVRDEMRAAHMGRGQGQMAAPQNTAR
jgi:uncharacterized membrane protein YqiK